MNLNPTMHYNFAVDKTLQPRRGPLPVLTRATAATYRDSDTLIKSAATGVERYEHDVNGVCRGYLPEKTKTNILLYNTDFGTTWTPGSNAVINTDQSAGPGGAATMDQLIDDNGGGSGVIAVTQNGKTVEVNQIYCMSCFVKADGSDQVRFDFANNVGVNTQFFDLTDGSIGASGANILRAGTLDYGDGVYRCWATFTADAVDTTGNFEIDVAEGGTISLPRDGTSSIFLWGAQLEKSRFPSSVIFTEGTTATRNTDQLYSSDVSWLNEDGTGSWFMHALFSGGAEGGGTLNDFGLVQCSSNSTTQRLPHYINNGGITMTFTNGGYTGNPMTCGGAVTSPLEEFKVATRFFQDNAAHFNGGTKISADLTCDTTKSWSFTKLWIGEATLSSPANWEAPIAELAYMPDELDDDTLAALSAGTLQLPTSQAYIAITRRTAEQMNVKQRMPKPRNSLRGSFGD